MKSQFTGSCSSSSRMVCVWYGLDVEPHRVTTTPYVVDGRASGSAALRADSL